MKQIQKLESAFADCPAASGFKVENVRFYPESFGNEEATLRYGSLKMHFLSDRGAIYADILIPEQHNTFINMAGLMQRFGFAAKSRDPIINLREFFRRYERRLLELGDALVRRDIPSDIADLIITHTNKVEEWVQTKTIDRK